MWWFAIVFGDSDSNMGPKTCYPDWVVSWLSTGLSGKCRKRNLKIYHDFFLPCSSPFIIHNHPIISHPPLHNLSMLFSIVKQTYFLYRTSWCSGNCVFGSFWIRILPRKSADRSLSYFSSIPKDNSRKGLQSMPQLLLFIFFGIYHSQSSFYSICAGGWM